MNQTDTMEFYGSTGKIIGDSKDSLLCSKTEVATYSLQTADKAEVATYSLLLTTYMESTKDKRCARYG